MAGRFSIDAVFRAVDQITRPVSRMQRSIGRFTQRAEAGFRRMDRMAGKISGTLRSVGTRIGTAMGGASLATGGAVTMLNRANAQNQVLAESVGMSVGRLEAMQGALQGTGFEAQEVVDMMEEMNNKIGESRGLEEMSLPTKEALQIMNIEFERLRDMAPEDQFELIANKALQMEDAQKAASAADILMGGQAGKMISVLRQQGASMDEIMARYRDMNSRTSEGREGAREFNRAISDSQFAITSLASEVSGLASKHLTPLIRRFNEFIQTNRELIKTRTLEWLEWLVDNFEDVVKWMGRIAATIGIWFAFHAALKTVIAVMTVFNAVLAANPITLIVLGIMAAIVAIGALVAWVLKATGVADSWGEAFQMVIDGVVTGLRWMLTAGTNIIKGFGAVWYGLGAIIRDSIGLAVQFLKTAFGSVIALLTGDWDAFAEYWQALWASITKVVETVMAVIQPLVDEISEKIGMVKDAAAAVADFFGYGDEAESPDTRGERGGRAGAAAPEVNSPQERVAREVSESRQTEENIVTIRDESGRAEDTTGRGGGRGVRVESSGAT